jgi:protein involved in polysaccharide export with SLBB domain
MPGIYQAKSEFTLVQAIALAQGFTAQSDKNNVEITRSGSEKITVSLQAVLTGKTPDVVIKDGDVIRVTKFKQ